MASKLEKVKKVKELRMKLHQAKTQELEEKQNFEEKLRNQSMFTQTVFNMLPFMIFCRDENRNYIFVNDSLAKFFKKSVDEMSAGLDVDTTISVTSEQNSNSLLPQSDLVEDVYDTEGRECSLHTIQRVHRVPYCAKPVIFGYSEDITPQIILERRLMDAKHKAEESKNHKEPFFGEKNQEFKRPMSEIVDAISSLRESKPLTEEQKQFGEMMHLSSQNLLTILNNAIDYSRIESRKIQLEKKAFNLKGILNAVSSYFSNAATYKTLRLECKEYPQDLPTHFLGDQERVFQILYNIVDNAIKFTPQGVVTISTTFNKEETNIFMVTITIADTGPGIKTNELSRLFLRSPQELQLFPERMNLFLSQQLIDLMGGSMTVISGEGKGTVFQIHFKFTAAY